MNRNLALEFVRITEAAALACSTFMGRGNEKAADQAAVDAMRKAFDAVEIDGTVVIGEGERDEAPMLYIGEKVGNKRPGSVEVDIALDPLEGTTICAQGGDGAISVIAAAGRGDFLHAPDTYMEKIACGPKARGAISLQKSLTENLKNVAEALSKPLSHVTVVMLNRPRHENAIREVRELGARIRLINDGDVSGAIATCWEDTGIDLLYGIGGAPEGVIAAAAIKCMGGDFEGRLKFRNDEERQRATRMGVADLDAIFKLNDLVKGPCLFCATGVTDGPLLQGVRTRPGQFVSTQSIVMRSQTGTIRKIETMHNLNVKPVPGHAI